MSSTNKPRVPPNNAQARAQEQRQALNRSVIASSVQLRKRRKEEVLRKRRRQLPQVASLTTPLTVVEAQLKALLLQPERETLQKFHDALQGCEQSAAFLQGLVDNHPDETRMLTKLLTQFLVPIDQSAAHSLGILLEISSLPSSTNTEADYYGHVSLRWSDMFAEEEPLLIALVRLLSDPSTAELASNIIGNLVQDSQVLLRHILKFWQELVAALPTSAYACAVAVRQDMTSFGSFFLSALRPNLLVELLSNERTSIYCAWILAGLSRREDAVVDALCADAALMSAFVLSFCSATERLLSEGAIESTISFLAPMLRAVGYMTTACCGRYVEFFLHQTVFVNAVLRLLDLRRRDASTLVVNLIWVAGCLLSDAGTPKHASTTIGAPQIVPRLTAILNAPEATLEWRREATHALRTAVSEPPSLSEFSSPVVESNLVNILAMIWSSHPLEALLELLHVPDTDAVLAALYILNRLLRSLPESRSAFAQSCGVERLEEVCHRAADLNNAYSNDMELAADMAAKLLDDIFDDEEEEDYDTAPTIEGDSFGFGLPESAMPPAFAFSQPAQQPSQGRGRGRTLPSWMLREN